MTSAPSTSTVPPRLRSARVLRVAEEACEVWTGGTATSVRFAPLFPSPRVERVSAGHLVAIATSPTGGQVVVWRWYDAVVLAHGDAGSVHLWEPAHGEVIAQARPSYQPVEPGARAYASAGLPGAEWWVAGAVTISVAGIDVDVDAVHALYTDNDLWPAVFEPQA